MKERKMLKKRATILTSTLVSAVALSSGFGQGAFQNLDFESAVIVSLGVTDPSITQYGPAFPGWTAHIGTNLVGYAVHNQTYLDTSGIGIVDHNWTSGVVGLGGVIEGNFSA